eukprot:1348903-Karenia_brevis.AAC.1
MLRGGATPQPPHCLRGKQKVPTLPVVHPRAPGLTILGGNFDDSGFVWVVNYYTASATIGSEWTTTHNF